MFGNELVSCSHIFHLLYKAMAGKRHFLSIMTSKCCTNKVKYDPISSEEYLIFTHTCILCILSLLNDNKRHC